ncbi:MAG: hypothetical protein KF799_05885 [Bdellovibrionales bacterium]|nr:hypothetical protein [Bdellovibrionales bacterium]
MFVRSTLFALALIATLPALAEPLSEIKSCHLQGRMRLSEATQIFCDGDMLIDDGAEIITEGHELQIWISGKAYFGGSSKGFQIRSFDEASLGHEDGATAGSPVVIYAATASGFLRVDSQGLTENALGGDVAVEYGSTYDYDHELYTGRAASIEMVRAGEMVALTGPNHKPFN